MITTIKAVIQKKMYFAKAIKPYAADRLTRKKTVSQGNQKILDIG